MVRREPTAIHGEADMLRFKILLNLLLLRCGTCRSRDRPTYVHRKGQVGTSVWWVVSQFSKQKRLTVA
jgi:hypothetical protein